MVYAILREQLGNQLFIWAAGFSLSREWNCPLRLITTNYGRTGTYMYLRVFPVTGSFLSPIPGLMSRWLLGRELYTLQKYRDVVGDWDPAVEGCFERSRFEDLRTRKSSSLLLDGMFQSWRYFDKHRDAIRGELAVTGSRMTQHCDQEMLRRVQDVNSVSVHVRRTDYIHGGDPGKFAVCTKAYFVRCMNFFRDTAERPEFFVFSDDIGWAKSEIAGPDVHFVSSTNYRSRNIADFVLMANCRHHVISNSTFSWWAAYAGDCSGVVLMPCRWFNDGSAAFADKCVDGWVPVSVD
jgi:hypothetical protein